jgi:hypothetical protein
MKEHDEYELRLGNDEMSEDESEGELTANTKEEDEFEFETKVEEKDLMEELFGENQ